MESVIYRQFLALINSLTDRVAELESDLESEKHACQEYESSKRHLAMGYDDLVHRNQELQRQVESYREDSRQFHAIKFQQQRDGLFAKTTEMAEIRRLIQYVGMIPAIKYARSVAPFGLKEAKDFCDGLAFKESIPIFGR